MHVGHLEKLVQKIKITDCNSRITSFTFKAVHTNTDYIPDTCVVASLLGKCSTTCACTRN